MARNRLTHRSAAADKTPYSGTVNQDRKDPEMDQYHTFEQTVNHELPDMRTEWKNDQRNEIGFGIPTVASVRSAASKAVKLAVLLLGEKAPEDVIEAQAREFMKLGGKGLEASLLNFASTEKLYAEEEKKDEEVKAAVAVKAEEAPKVEDKKEEVKASAHKCSCSTATTAEPVKAEEAPKVEDKKEEVKASVAVKAEEAPKVEDKKEEVKAAEVAPVAVKAEEAPKVEDKKEEVKASVVAEEDKKDEMEVEASDDKDEDDVVATDDKDEDDKEVAASELDVQLGGDEMDEVKAEDGEDELLASLYAGEEDAEEEKAEAKKASAKKGIKKLGGQPKLASAPKTASDDLSGIWASAPDVSNIFE